MISVIDMPPPEDSIWWRGKRGFEVGFFPCECVEVIGDKVPNNLNLPHNAQTSNTLPHLSRRDSSSPCCHILLRLDTLGTLLRVLGLTYLLSLMTYNTMNKETASRHSQTM